MSADIESLVSAAVEKALGGSSDKPAAAPTPSQPAAQAASPFDQYMQLLATEKAQELATKYKSPGAVASAPSFDESDPGSLRHATREDVERLRRDGQFLTKLEGYRNSLPGGAGTLFKNRLPK